MLIPLLRPISNSPVKAVHFGNGASAVSFLSDDREKLETSLPIGGLQIYPIAALMSVFYAQGGKFDQPAPLSEIKGYMFGRSSPVSTSTTEQQSVMEECLDVLRQLKEPLVEGTKMTPKGQELALRLHRQNTDRNARLSLCCAGEASLTAFRKIIDDSVI